MVNITEAKQAYCEKDVTVNLNNSEKCKTKF